MNNHSDYDWLADQPTNQITNSMEQSPSREANISSASWETTRIYGIPKFITALTSTCHLSLSWARSLQFMPPHPTSWRSILILFSHLCLGLQGVSFRSPHQNPVCTLSFPYVPHALPISFFLIWSPKKHWWVQIIKASCYLTFFTPLLPS